MNILSNILRAIDSAVTVSGKRFVALAGGSPVLLVFLRHAGCTFCRQALADIARERPAIEATGARIILVHMGDSKPVENLLERYGLHGVERICDADRSLYRAFGLKKGRLLQLLRPSVLWRGFKAAILDGHGLGFPSADPSQMPGIFLVQDSAIVHRFRHRTAADRPGYTRLCAALLTPRAAKRSPSPATVRFSEES